MLDLKVKYSRSQMSRTLMLQGEYLIDCRVCVSSNMTIDKKLFWTTKQGKGV